MTTECRRALITVAAALAALALSAAPAHADPLPVACTPAKSSTTSAPRG